MNSKKSNISRILLSVVALLVIATVAVGITYSWIEGGTQYLINGNLITANKSPLNTVNNGTITLTPTASSNSVNLLSYDNTTDVENLIFSPVSSDGESFYFPIAYDSAGKPSYYREATTNDVGTKFISYDFDVKTSTKQCYVALDGAPTITVTSGEGVAVTDTSAFRIMLKCGDVKRVLSSKAATDTVIKSADGKTTATSTVAVFDNFVKDAEYKNKLFEFPASMATKSLQVAIWLDADSVTDAIKGTEVSINLNLIVAEEKINVTFNTVTFNNKNVIDSTLNGGTYKIGTSATSYDGEQSASYAKGATVTATASANENYEFGGWYTTADCSGTAASETVNLSKTVTEEITYYAKFVEKPKFTVNVQAGANGSAVITDNNSTSIEVYKDSTISLSATASSASYEFGGWYTSSDFSGSAVSTANPWELTVTEGKTYYAYFKDAKRTTTIYFEPRNYENHYAYVYNNKDYNTTKHFSNSWAGTQMSVDSATGYYKFEYTGYETGDFYVIVNSGSDANQYPGQNKDGLRGTLGRTYLFKAGEPTDLVDFNPADLITVEVTAETGGTATVNGKTSVKVLNGDTVQLVATPTQNSGYGFAGWYNGSTQVGTSSETTKTVTINATAGSTVTYTAKFEKTTKTVYVGVIEYQNDNFNANNLTLHCWNDAGLEVDVTGTKTGDTFSKAVGSSYWSNAAQKFYIYQYEIDSEATHFRLHNGDTWYGSDAAISSGNCLLLFEWSNSYHIYQTNY